MGSFSGDSSGRNRQQANVWAYAGQVTWYFLRCAVQNKPFNHDDVINWKHFPRHWTFVRGIHRSPVNSPHKGQWRGAFMFSLICTRINGWVNNGEAGNLRRHRAHYDVIVMSLTGLLCRQRILKYYTSGLPLMNFAVVRCQPSVSIFFTINSLALREWCGQCNATWSICVQSSESINIGTLVLYEYNNVIWVQWSLQLMNIAVHHRILIVIYGILDLGLVVR